MAHTKYIVKQGDCISSIAFAHGLFPETVWNDSKNSRLKQDRKDPNVLKPGDEVYIRDREAKEESCSSDQKHRFKRKGVPEKLIVYFQIKGEPIANENYVLDIDGVISEGTTGGDGKVEIFIPPDARKGTITFRDSGEAYNLELGHLDPVTEITGIQGRLSNLGFYQGEIDGEMSDDLVKAIRAFQESNGMEPTGSPDKSLQDKLEQVYGV